MIKSISGCQEGVEDEEEALTTLRSHQIASGSEDCEEKETGTKLTSRSKVHLVQSETWTNAIR